MRVLAFVFPLLLAACSNSHEPRRAPVMTADAVVASSDASLLQVTLHDVPPGGHINQILLVAPDGARTPSRARETTQSEGGPGYGPAGVGVTIGGGSSSGISTGVTVGVESSGGTGSDYASTTVQAAIDVPDPALYRRDPDAWHIEILWTDVTGLPQILPLRAPRP